MAPVGRDGSRLRAREHAGSTERATAGHSQATRRFQWCQFEPGPPARFDFEASFLSLQWTVNAYALTLAAFLLLGGSLGDHFG